MSVTALTERVYTDVVILPGRTFFLLVLVFVSTVHHIEHHNFMIFGIFADQLPNKGP
jgi:hypothetical protein